MKQILYITLLLFPFFSMAQPANNLCEDATEITDLDGGCASFTNTGATNTGNPYLPGCFDNTHTVWFSFTAEGPNADVTISGSNNQLERPEIALIGLPLDSDGTGDLCNIEDVVQYACTNPNGNYTTATLTVSNNVLVPGWTYLVVVSSRDQGTFNICIDNPENTSPTTCANAEPFCTEDGPVSYDAGVNDGSAQPGNAYGCLVTQPNPAWFFLEIDAPGDMEITMASDPAEDIDYIMWGPFEDLDEACGNLTSENIVDCSFLALTTEIGLIEGAQTGEIYILMITNFSNNETDIIFSQTDGDATTNCDIVVLPIELLDFSVEAKPNGNELTWITATERNNDFFRIDYSQDGFTWKEVHREKGQGFSVDENIYSYTHESSFDGIVYYKLTQVDYDGLRESFDPVAIDNASGKVVVNRLNLLGQEVDANYRGVVIHVYANGDRKKVMQ